MSSASAAPIRVLTFTTLFPNAVEPNNGIFVEQRLRHLAASGRVEARVVAPVPWFPSRAPIFGRYAGFARVPPRETRFGIPVEHPRYGLLPKIGLSTAPFLLARGAWKAVRQLVDSGFDFDVIDAHFYYPDGVAAAMIARRIGKPLFITARGTDVNLYPRHAVARRLMLWAERQASGSIAVAGALRDAMIAMGMRSDRIYVLRNGVDLSRFRPHAPAEARAHLGWHGKTALSVGYLIERKGHHFAIEALRLLPDWRLAIVGSGEWEQRLRDLARDTGVADRVQFVGAVRQDSLPLYYSAADLLVLASSREGMANVLLEALACGTPAVATNAWGNPEVIRVPEAGELMQDRSAAELAAAVRRLEARSVDRAATRRYAETLGWDATTAGQLELFGAAIAAARRSA